LLISLVTSTVTEAFASALGWRANTLLSGIKDLLNDQNFTGLAKSIYAHAAVNPRDDGTPKAEADLKSKPSYIDPKQFAGALIDVLNLAPAAGAAVTVAALQNQISTSPMLNDQLKTMLNGVVARTGGNINRVRDELASWFDTGMERVAGDYKRKTQIWGFVIGLICAIVLNVDIVKIAEALWDQPMLMKGFATPTGQLAQDVIAQAQQLGLPFGWNPAAVTYAESWQDVPYMIVGWLLAAVATLFGAPFWFDALQKFVQLRGAGSK
jgi:hypothetical protein